MKIGATLRIESETNDEAIQGFKGMNVQPFFRSRSFSRLKHTALEKSINDAGINLLSLHYPSRADNFLGNLKMLKETYHQTLFTVHPTGKSLDEFLRYLASIEKEITTLGVELAFENMPFRGKWHNNPGDIYKIAREFPFASVTYDTTHLPKDINAIEGLEDLNKTKIIHLSNVRYGLFKKDHLPIDQGERDLLAFLRYLKQKDFKGQVILEYRIHEPAFLRQEIEKAKALAI